MGRRELKDEKSVVAELAKMLNISRAEGVAASIIKKKDRNLGQKAATQSASAAAKKGFSTKTALSEETKEKRQARRKAQKRKSNGSSVTLVLKGGITALTKSGPQQAAFRGRRSEKLRVQAAESARLYMESAHEQAQSAGLSEEGGDESERAQYLLSQRLEAAALLHNPKVVGAHLLSLAGKTTLGTQKGKVVPSTPLPPAPLATRDARASFEAALVQEAVLTGVAPPTTPDQIEAARASFYFVPWSGDDDVRNPNPASVPGRCVLRCKGPCGTKATAILTTAKSALYLKSALAQAIRKEMFNVLRRDADESQATSTH